MSRDVNPFIVTLFFLARCLIPLLVMLAVSYVLRRLGLLPEPSRAPEESAPGREDDQTSGENNGGMEHGAA